jgi:hypothetical protein
LKDPPPKKKKKKPHLKLFSLTWGKIFNKYCSLLLQQFVCPIKNQNNRMYSNYEQSRFSPSNSLGRLSYTLETMLLLGLSNFCLAKGKWF